MARRTKPTQPSAAAAATDTDFADKIAAVDALRAARNSSQDAEMALRVQKQDAEADAVWEKTSRLSLEIDLLIGKMMQDWSADAGTYADTLRKISGEIDGAVEKIKKAQDTAKSVVAVLGAIDQVLAIGARLLI